MEKIIYQGQSIEVERVDEINTVRGEGSDNLYRATDGIYYLERDRMGLGKQPRGHGAREDFYSLHRINITAAILWAMGNLRNPILRMEAADCLMDVREGQSHFDPNPHSYFEIKKARGKQDAARWVKRVLAGKALPAPAKRRTLNEARAAIGEPRLVEETIGSNIVPQLADGTHRVTLDLTAKQFGMLRQAAKYTGDDPEDFIMDSLCGNVLSYLTDIFGHRQERAQVGWDGSGEKPSKRGRIPRPPVPEDKLPISAETRAILERRARVEGTDLRTQYEFMTTHGTNAVLGFSKRVTAELDPFYGDLLRAFERRNNVDADDYARAVLEWHLEEMYDFPFNGGSAERDMAEDIREYGHYVAAMNDKRLEKLCRAAGLRRRGRGRFRLCPSGDRHVPCANGHLPLEVMATFTGDPDEDMFAFIMRSRDRDERAEQSSALASAAFRSQPPVTYSESVLPSAGFVELADDASISIPDDPNADTPGDPDPDPPDYNNDEDGTNDAPIGEGNT